MFGVVGYGCESSAGEAGGVYSFLHLLHCSNMNLSNSISSMLFSAFALAAIAR